MNVDAIIGSDGRDRVLGCWKAAQAYMDAADSAKKQQLLGDPDGNGCSLCGQ